MEHKFKVSDRVRCIDDRADMDDRDMVQGDWVFERVERVQEAAQDSDDPQHSVVMVSTDVDAGAPASEQEDIGSAATSKHYNSKLIQPIQIAQMVLTAEEFKGAMKFNIMKYTQRAGSKEGESSQKDWNKALQYKLWLELAEAGVVIDPKRDIV